MNEQPLEEIMPSKAKRIEIRNTKGVLVQTEETSADGLIIVTKTNPAGLEDGN